MRKSRMGSQGDLAKRVLPAALIILMVLAIGFIGYNATQAATAKAEDVHLQDRLALQSTLADLSSQYLLLGLAEASDYANAQPWTLTPGDSADTQRLTAFVASSRLLNHDAALLDLTGSPLNQSSRNGGLPPRTDSGYQPMIAGLLARKPGVSSVILFQGHPIVALAVPVVRSGTPVAIFVAAFRADQNALESYTQKVSFGSTGKSLILDSRGGVVAAHDPKLVGTKLSDAAVARLQSGQKGVLQFGGESDRKVASFAPITVGGWGSISEQNADEFFGPIRTSNASLQVILLLLLLLSAITLGALNFKRQEAMREAALFDSLTGLHNRRALYALGDHELKRAVRTKTSTTLLFLDLDNLKQINDTHGHAVGDEAICEAAGVLKSVCRSSDLISRVGGDEFCVLVSGIDAQVMMSRVHDELEKGRPNSERPYQLGLSVGVARLDLSHPQTIQELMSEADRSMYFQKRAATDAAVEPAAGTALS